MIYLDYFSISTVRAMRSSIIASFSTRRIDRAKLKSPNCRSISTSDLVITIRVFGSSLVAQVVAAETSEHRHCRKNQDSVSVDDSEFCGFSSAVAAWEMVTPCTLRGWWTLIGVSASAGVTVGGADRIPELRQRQFFFSVLSLFSCHHRRQRSLCVRIWRDGICRPLASHLPVMTPTFNCCCRSLTVERGAALSRFDTALTSPAVVASITGQHSNISKL